MMETKDVGKLILPRMLTLITCDDGVSGVDAMPLDMIIPISSRPNIIMIVLPPECKTFQNILGQEKFVINVLPRTYLDKILGCAKTYPRGVDKLGQVGLTSYPSEKTGLKRVKEAKAWIECRLSNKMKVGENMLVFAEPECIEVDDSIYIDGDIDIVKIDPPMRISESGFVGIHSGG